MIINQRLEEFKEQYYQFSIDDSLVNFNATKAIQVEQTFIFKKQAVKSVLKEALFFEKESGINSLCLVEGVVKLNYRYKIINTPVFVKSCRFQEDKVNKIIRFESEEESFEINPFLQFYCKELYDKEFISTKDCLNFLKNNLNENFSEKETFIGNFHPYRHRFLFEVNNILVSESFSRPLQHLFGELTSAYQEDKLSANVIFNCDEDQQKVTELITNESLIIQGPPGTGKSQTISNTIFKFLELNKTILVISEKKAALDVIHSKLKERNLDLISLFITSTENNQEIFKSLMNTWIYFENYQTENQINSSNNSKNLKQIEVLIEGFQNKEAIDGISIKNFFNLSSKIDLNSFKTSGINLPKLKEYNSYKNILLELSSNDFDIIKLLNFNFVQLGNSELTESISSSYKSIIELKKTFHINQIADLNLLINKAILFQSFSSSVYKKFGGILTKNTKKFLSLRKKWNQLKIELAKHKIQENHWLKKPSFDEIAILKNQANSDKIYDKIVWKSRWKKWTRSPELDAIKQLASYEQTLLINLEIGKIKNQLLELDVANTAEIETIYTLIKTTNLSEWIDFIQTDEEQLSKILNSHSKLKRLQEESLCFLDLKYFETLETSIEKLYSNLNELIDIKTQLKGISKSVFESLKHASNFAEYEELVYANAWRNYVSENPVFRNFEFSELYSMCKIEIAEQKEKAINSSHFIIEKQVEKFKSFHNLINTSNSKLKEDQKEFKARLKKGKSILVKEFSKQRNHLSLRQLIETEAEIWLSVLKPICLTNPTKLAVSFPMKQELFDLVIFDEAGRIPLTHGLGALQRAKKAIVAGDPQQMGPSTYFGENQIDETDLLHQATYYFKNVFLSNHYRSKSKNLIEFSNNHFYDNKLKVYPNFNSLNEQVVQFKFVKNGIYKDGQNEIEASQVASEIEKRLLLTENLGIVAFSETQLNLIFSKLSNNSQELLLERISNDSAFFKTLEQVQGDECDLLLISFGYGKNDEGKFEMRFGPLNQHSGQKRLNVLFTRARNRILFFASVNASNFPISENESVRILWLWFCFIEKSQTKPDEKAISNELSFKELVYSSISSVELLNKISVWEDRGWKFTF
jgi:superfamily I DNA and/or RNA helicase